MSTTLTRADVATRINEPELTNLFGAAGSDTIAASTSTAARAALALALNLTLGPSAAIVADELPLLIPKTIVFAYRASSENSERLPNHIAAFEAEYQYLLKLILDGKATISGWSSAVIDTDTVTTSHFSSDEPVFRSSDTRWSSW